MRRLAFTLIAAISFLVCIPCILDAIIGDHSGGGIHWDMKAQQWLPVAPETPRERQHRIVLRTILIPITGAIVLTWLTQFLRKQFARDREWRGLYQSYGSDVPVNTAHLSKCEPPSPLSYHNGPLPRRRHFGPGATAIILLLIFVPIGTAIVYFLLILVLLTIWPPAI